MQSKKPFLNLLKTLKNPSLRFELTNKICNSYGFNITSKLQSTCLGDRLVEFFKVLFGTSRITALCNVIAWQQGLLKEIVPDNILQHSNTISESSASSIEPSTDAKDKLTSTVEVTGPLSQNSTTKEAIVADIIDEKPLKIPPTNGKDSSIDVVSETNSIKINEKSGINGDKGSSTPEIGKNPSQVQQKDHSEGSTNQEKQKG